LVSIVAVYNLFGSATKPVSFTDFDAALGDELAGAVVSSDDDPADDFDELPHAASASAPSKAMTRIRERAVITTP
jgi:hypothetical protein